MELRKGLPLLGLTSLLLLYITLALGFSATIPLSKAPDEYVHFLYSRFLVDNIRPPINQAEQRLAGYKSDQPPLYHSLVALLTSQIDVSEPPAFKFTWEPASRRLIDIVLPRALLVRTEDETWPLKGVFLAWSAGRWVSILLSTATIVMTYIIAREIFSDQSWLALASAGTLAFIPRYIFTGAVLNDDNLIGLLLAVFLFLIVMLFKYQTRASSRFVLLGVVVGLALNTKNTALPVPAETVVFISWIAWRAKWALKTFVSRLLIFGVTTALIASVWFGFLLFHFNQIQEYGLLPGILRPILLGGNSEEDAARVLSVLPGGVAGSEDISRLTTDSIFEWWRFFFTQFWHVPVHGVSPSYSINTLLLIALALCILAVIGWVGRWQSYRAQRLWLGVLGVHVLTILLIPLLRFVFLGRINDTAQARHLLFPAAPAVAILLVAGVVANFPLKWQRWAGLAVAATMLLFSTAHLYYYSEAFPPPLPVRTDQALADVPDTPLSVEFVDGLRLRGFNWQISNLVVLNLNLLWYATGAPHADYRSEITLRDAEGELRLSWLSHPAGGRFPTRAWEAGDSVRDTLNIPLVGLPAGEYQLALRLLDEEDNSLTSSQGDEVVLTSLKLSDTPSDHDPVLWQSGRPRSDVPVYRYRAAIPVTVPGNLPVNLIGPNGQTYRSLASTGQLHMFLVDYDWPSGKYRVQVDGADADLALQVENFDWNFTPPEMMQAVNANFNDDLLLLGYDLPTRRASAGDGIPLVLYWQSLQRMPKSYIIFDRLLDDEQRVWGGYDRLPKETYPTNFWVPGEVVVDGFAVPIELAAPDGIYNIAIGLYDEADPVAASIPLVQHGQPTDQTSVTVGPIKVGGPPADLVLSEAEVTPEIALAVELGAPPVILLRGYDLLQDSDTVQLTFFWESLAQTPVDWSIFVHFRDGSGKMVVQKDGPAGSGKYPTSLWEPGETIIDKIDVSLPADLPSGEYSIVTGLYDLTDGSRLSVPDSPNNEIILSTQMLTQPQ